EGRKASGRGFDSPRLHLYHAVIATLSSWTATVLPSGCRWVVGSASSNTWKTRANRLQPAEGEGASISVTTQTALCVVTFPLMARLYRELSLAAQTSYAELVEQLRAQDLQSLAGLVGSFQRRSIKGHEYVYFGYRDPIGGAQRRAYVGPADKRVQ